MAKFVKISCSNFFFMIYLYQECDILKKKLLLLACLFLGITLTGCGKATENKLEVFKKAMVSELTSYEAKATANAKVESEGVSVDISLPVTLKLDLKDGIKAYAKVEKTSLIPNDVEVYVTLNDKTVTAYTSTEDEEGKYWVKSTENLDESLNLDASNYKEETKKYIDKYLTDDTVKYIGEEDSLKHYQVIINDNLLQQIAKDFEQELEKTGIEFKIDVYLNKDNNIAKVRIDFVDVLSKAAELAKDEIEDSQFDLSAIKTLDITVEFTNHNNTKVEIPEDVIKNAIDTNDFDYDFDDEL